MLRVAQLMNPHSLMTRHSVGEAIAAPVVHEALVLGAGPLFVILGDARAGGSRARGHGLADGLDSPVPCAAMQRWPAFLYRSLEPLLMVHGAGLIARPDLIQRTSQERCERSCCTRDALGDTAHPLVFTCGWTWWRSW